VDWRQAIAVINDSAIASPLVGYKAAMLAERDFTPMFTAAQMAKDLDLALEAARGTATPMPLAAGVRQGFTALQARKRGELDFFSYVTLLEDLAGLPAIREEKDA
jgi:3-hydroxyisobutyrate dehydrogenase-like beta-hydroxyacid dehydrogenase